MSRIGNTLDMAQRGVDGARRLPARVHDTARTDPRRFFLRLGALAAVLVVLGGVFSYLAASRNDVETARVEAKASGERTVTTLLSYDHRSLESELGSRRASTTGRFSAEYENLLRSSVLPAAQSRQLTTQTSVAGSSVIRDEGVDHVWLLMYLNQTSSSGIDPKAVPSSSRVRVGLERTDDAQWRVAELTPM